MKTIVIIEDDTDAQEVYQKILARHNFRTFFASTGQLGLQLIQAELPHAIILDLMLPGSLSGMEVMKAIKSHPALTAIPIVVVTNLSSEKENAFAHGATSFLVKATTSTDELIKEIKKVLNIT